MKDLTLNLIGKWFSMILKGFKTVEYRAITPLYCSKLMLFAGEHKKPQWWFDWYFHPTTDVLLEPAFYKDLSIGNITFKRFRLVKFNNGMKKVMPRMKLGFKKIDIGEGEKVLGAEEGVSYFRIHLGLLISSENINLLKR